MAVSLKVQGVKFYQRGLRFESAALVRSPSLHPQLASELRWSSKKNVPDNQRTQCSGCRMLGAQCVIYEVPPRVLVALHVALLSTQRRSLMCFT